MHAIFVRTEQKKTENDSDIRSDSNGNDVMCYGEQSLGVKFGSCDIVVSENDLQVWK